MWLFNPTANLTDFDRVQDLKNEWSRFINYIYETSLYGRDYSAFEELRNWGISDSDLRVYNPASMPIPDSSQARNVVWSALPTSFDEQFTDILEKLQYLDQPQQFPSRPLIVTRIQDEYCEWIVRRNEQNQITSVVFTSEPPEYYNFLFDLSDASRRLLVDLYREITGVSSIKDDDLVDNKGNYNWWNRYNNEFAVHMQQPNNTLRAQVNIFAHSSLLRANRSGEPVTDALSLINCAQYGDPNRQSDPKIGHAINTFARENRFISLENPVGLYMSGVDWNGWETPDNSDPGTYWTVLRGSQSDDPNQSYIVRAEYAVPPDKGFTVSDITIGGEPISFGGQIAACINVRVAVMVSEPSQLPAPRPIGCRGVTPPPPSQFTAMIQNTTGGARMALSPQKVEQQREDDE